MNTPKTLVIHSSVAHGFVGSNVTSFLLQLNGIETITIPTVLYSNHLGHDIYGGGVIPNKLFHEVISGIANFGILPSIERIITGYLGTIEQIELTESLIKKIKSINPNVQYICDPVMGDTEGLYVSEDIPKALQELLIPLADILTPNAFEFTQLCKTTIEENLIKEAATSTFDLFRQKVIITGCSHSKSPELITYLLDKEQLIRYINPEIDVHPAGTGELFTALLSLQLHTKTPIERAIEIANSILEKTLKTMNHVQRPEFTLEDMLFAQKLYQENSK